MIGGHARAYTDVKTRSDEALIRHFASQAMAGLTPIAGPIAITVQVFIQPPASWSKKKREAALYVTGKPDVDNQVKILGDSLNGIVWHDDSQITDVQFSRRYSLTTHEHVSVTVVALDLALAPAGKPKSVIEQQRRAVG